MIERSIDGGTFETLKDVSALGNSDIELNYQSTDYDPTSGFNYYRVKQVLMDGSIRYSQMRQVIFEMDLNSVSIFPNPATDEAFVHLKEFAGLSASIIIYDQLGQAVQSMDVATLTEAPVHFLTPDLQAGIYHVAIQIDNKKVISKKLVVQKR